MALGALPQIDLVRCTLCGKCVSACPVQAVAMLPPGPQIVAPEACTYCTACEAICPEHAITCAFEIVWE
ncbi:MAG: NADH dehydrogenase subunit I [Chloroflexi bacterium ADurb.Bin360]|nr:MAG: NADH dehydrogenase subunit I [Chloroflexi bacterium ADurb.Bin360]